MSNIVLYEQKTFVAQMVQEMSVDEASSLMGWGQKMLEIRDSRLSWLQKVKAAYAETLSRKVIMPAMKRIALALKKHAWDERGNKSRLGIAVAGATAMTFGGQAAGIAALGGAISVPLWVVFGSGAVFAAQIVEEGHKKIVELKASSKSNIVDAVYEVL